MAFRLPRARYTVFTRYDPAEAVTSFAIVDQRGRRWPDFEAIPARVGDVMAPLVQHELRAGVYHIEIGTTTPTCSWQVQVVLNSMMALRMLPPEWRPSSAAPEVLRVRGGDPPMLRVTQTGQYEAGWTVGEASARPAFHAYSLDLRAADGHVVELGVGSATGDHRAGYVFLGAGQWTVEMTTNVGWELVLTPVVGPTGGGAHGF